MLLKNKLENKDEGLNLQRMTNWKLNKVNPDSHPWLVPYVLLVIRAGGENKMLSQDKLHLFGAKSRG